MGRFQHFGGGLVGDTEEAGARSENIARTGDPFSGLWYTVGVVAMALVVTFFWLPETAGKNLD